MDEDLKSRLLKPRLPEAEVEIPDIGTVRVRGLSRAESMVIQGMNGLEETERKILHFGMVDPAMTEDEAGEWQNASPGAELEPVVEKIAALSGMVVNAPKEQYKSVRDEPDA